MFVLTSVANRNASKSRLVAATLCAGLYPQLGKILRPTKRFVEVMGNAVERDLQAKELKFFIPQMSLLSGTDPAGTAATITAASASASATSIKVPDKRNIDISVEDKHRVFLHPSSVNFDNSVFKESNFLMYGERQLVTYTNNNTGNHESKIYLRDTTEASAFALLFFGGVLEVEYSDGIVTVDGWIRYTQFIVVLLHALSSTGSVFFVLHLCRSFVLVKISITLSQVYRARSHRGDHPRDAEGLRPDPTEQVRGPVSGHQRRTCGGPHLPAA